MENPMTDTVPARDARAYLGHDTDVRAELREPRAAQELVGPAGARRHQSGRRRALDDLRDPAEMRGKQDARGGVTGREPEDPLQPPERLPGARAGDGLRRPRPDRGHRDHRPAWRARRASSRRCRCDVGCERERGSGYLSAGADADPRNDRRRSRDPARRRARDAVRRGGSAGGRRGRLCGGGHCSSCATG